MLHGFLILKKHPLCTLSLPFFFYLPELRGFLRCTQNKLLALSYFLLARVERLELPTPGFGDQCSTN
jgi:hypothetical protein